MHTCMRAVVAIFAVAAANADIMAFDDKDEFHLAVGLAGKVLKGIETFEGAVMGGHGKLPIPDPLEFGVPNMVGPNGFPTGLSQANLRIQANLDPLPSPATAMPAGLPDALYIAAPGFINSNSTKVGEDLGILHGIVASYDLIFLDDRKTGVGFDLSRFAGFNPSVGFIITVYDTSDNIMGVYNASAQTEPLKAFFGVWSTVPIGRINIFDDLVIPGQPTNTLFSPSAVDNVEMWIPEPGALSLVAVCLLAFRRRR